MSEAELDRSRRFALLLCELAAVAGPPDSRSRVVAERRSHLHESVRAGESAVSELTRALRGSLDDVRTGVSARAAGGAAPLRVAVFTDSSMSLAACGLLIGLLVPTLFVERFYAVFVGRSSTVLASIVLFGGYVTRAVQRLRARGTAVGG